jgi:hypothetical protein
MKLVSEVTDFSKQFSLTVQSFCKELRNMYETDTGHSVRILLKFTLCSIQHRTMKIRETGITRIYPHILNLYPAIVGG